MHQPTARSSARLHKFRCPTIRRRSAASRASCLTPLPPRLHAEQQPYKSPTLHSLPCCRTSCAAAITLHGASRMYCPPACARSLVALAESGVPPRLLLLHLHCRLACPHCRLALPALHVCVLSVVCRSRPALAERLGPSSPLLGRCAHVLCARSCVPRRCWGPPAATSAATSTGACPLVPNL